MAQFIGTTTIRKSAQDVFAVMSNPANDAKWSAAVIHGEWTSPGSPGIGSTARFVSKLFGRRLENVWEITGFERNVKFVALSRTGPFPVEVTTAVSPVRGGTRVEVTYAMEPRGIIRLAAPLLLGYGRRRLQEALDNLRGLMESGRL